MARAIAPQTANATKAQSVAVRYAERLDRIRADVRLSDVAKREQMAAAYLETTDEMTRLRQADEQTAAQRLSSLRQSVFGIADLVTPGDSVSASISYRDAQDRAANLKHEVDALAAVERAGATGDRILARAVAAHAFEQGWAAPLNAYTQAFPQYRAKLEELAGASQKFNSSAQLAGILGTHMAFTAPTPPELNGLGDYRIRSLAAGSAA